MQTWWGLLSADVHRRDGWRSAFLQMPTRMGNARLFYFFIFIETPYMKFVLQSSDAPENCGSILHQLIQFRSSSSTSRLRYLIWSARWTITRKWARVTKTTKMMIPAMLPLHRMNHALFLTATALVTRRRALPLRHHRLHHLQWVGTTEKAQRSLLCGGTATRTTLLLVTCCIVVFVVFS